MKKKILSLLAISSLLIAGCDYNDKHFDGLDDISKPTDMAGVEYTLTDADYGKIAAYKENKELATAMDAEMENPLDSVHYKALKEVGKANEFSDLILAKDFIVPFVAENWAYKDEKTAVKITYKKAIDKPEVITGLDVAKAYVVTGGDYQTVWGEGVDAKFFTDSKKPADFLPNILATNIESPTEGEYYIVDYNFSINEPGGTVEPESGFSEDFENGFTLEASDWSTKFIQGDRAWQVKTYNDNGYLQYSAYKAPGVQENYLVTPAIAVEAGFTFAFDVNVGNFNGKALTVHVAEDNATGEYAWTDITDTFTIPEPESGYASFATAGTYDLSAYVGKKVVFGFKYTGDPEGVTSTIQLDNIVVAPAATRALLTRAATPSSVSAVTDVYTFKGGEWKLDKNIVALQEADYKSLGFDDFSSSRPFELTLAKLLNNKFPFAAIDDVKTVVFKYYEKNSDDKFRSAQYRFDGNGWVFIPYFIEETAQFVRFEKNIWKFDPSVYLILVADRNAAASSAFYQPITDWVWENIDKGELGYTGEEGKVGETYTGKYGNNDYYFGTSAYQNNVDMRLNKYKEHYPPAYQDKTDEELKTFLMEERWPRAFKLGLEIAYPEADIVEGMDVIYTVNFGTYDGIGNSTYEMKYKVISKGEFEFVPESLEQIK